MTPLGVEHRERKDAKTDADVPQIAMTPLGVEHYDVSVIVGDVPPRKSP